MTRKSEKKMKEELELPFSEEHQDHIKATIEHMLEGVQIIGRDWKYIYVNEAASQHGVKPRSELLGRTMSECYPGIENTLVYANLERVMRTKLPIQMENLFEYQDGSSCWFELYIEPHALGVLLRSIDITKKKKLEEQYMHAQKMEALGRLTGGIAHDFNNKLGIILIYCEMIESELAKDHKAHRSIKQVFSAVRDSATLVKQLLAYSRNHPMDLRVSNLNDVLSSASEGITKLLGSSIDVDIHMETEIHNVRVDPTQIDQVLLNLAINARDAMPKGGKLTIETANVELDEEIYSTHPEVLPGEYVMLSVSDTGCGMNEETREKLFDPFFTTKKIGEGTGLGLPSVHGIVTQSQGHIWVYSEPGIGTTFKIFFPVVKERVESTDKVTPSHENLQGSETILLVEDDERLSIAYSEALRKVGYQVHTVADSKSAKRYFMSKKGKIDLLLTDVILPNLNGRELAQELSALNPDLKVVFISGYTENSILHHGVIDSEVVLLQKPVATRNLLSTIRQVLDGELSRAIV